MWKRAAAADTTKTRVQSYQNLLFPSFLLLLFLVTVGKREPCESSRRRNAELEIDLITRYKHTEHGLIVTYFGYALVSHLTKVTAFFSRYTENLYPFLFRILSQEI